MLNPLAALKKDTLESVLKDWLNQLKLSQNAINSILNLHSESETARKARYSMQVNITVLIFDSSSQLVIFRTCMLFMLICSIRISS